MHSSDHPQSNRQVPQPGPQPHPLHLAAQAETLADVEHRLKQSGYLALRRIHCEFRDGVLRMRGQLPSHYLKQVAVAVADEVNDVRAIVNEISVVNPARGNAARPAAWSA